MSGSRIVALHGFSQTGRCWGPFAAELRAAGARPLEPTGALQDLLSPQELQITLLAAEGLSNKEIGERLYMSHRTVGSHLYRIFPKLEVTSRAQLATRLNSP